MYTTCLRCERSLGTNTEIAHLPVGRRVAFDTTTGRLWVICRRCGQWNLMPIEERWEALAACEQLALAAESRAAGKAIGLARTTSGLELLRVGGMPNEDIANWRYGRRVRARQRVLWWIAACLGALAVLLGIRAGVEGGGSAAFGLWVAAFVGAVLGGYWLHPPRAWLRFTAPSLGTVRLWPWKIPSLRLAESEEHGRPVLVVPGRMGGEDVLEGLDAAMALAAILPKVDGAECAAVPLARVLTRVSHAETTSQAEERGVPNRRPGRAGAHPSAARARKMRPWERIALELTDYPLVTRAPELRLALEMAATEEVERAALRERAEALTDEWREEEEIGAIADDLLVPDAVRTELDALEREREDERDDDRQDRKAT